MVSAILLAAGQSRRMGAVNKLLLPFGSGTLLGNTLQNILHANPSEIIAVTGYEAPLVEAALLSLESASNASKIRKNSSDGLSPSDEFFYASPPLRIIHNPNFEQGMTSSIQAGVRAAHPDTQGLMVCLGDMPLLSPTTYRWVLAAFLQHLRQDPQAIVQPMFQGQVGHPVVFSNTYRSSIEALTYPDGCKPILQAHREHLYRIESPTDTVLMDADTPEAYAGMLQVGFTPAETTKHHPK